MQVHTNSFVGLPTYSKTKSRKYNISCATFIVNVNTYAIIVYIHIDNVNMTFIYIRGR